MVWKIVGLVSGGKDSIYSLVEAKRLGHEIVCLANLYPASSGAETPPETKDDAEEAAATELDSHCFQTVAHTVIPAIAECMELPLVRRETKGISVQRSLLYDGKEGEGGGDGAADEDEVEDLFHLLAEVKRRFPEVNAVSAGAIQSNYQRLRVESVAKRLGLQPLAFLWQREQHSLLAEMIGSGLEAVLVKVAACGLNRRMLGRPLAALQNSLRKANDEYGVSVLGEGGEYESSVLYCPQLFKGRKRIQLEETVVVDESKDDKWNVCAFLHVKRCSVVVGEPTGRDDSEPNKEAETARSSPAPPNTVVVGAATATIATAETVMPTSTSNISISFGASGYSTPQGPASGFTYLPGFVASVAEAALPADTAARKGSPEMRAALAHATTAILTAASEWLKSAGGARLQDALMLRLFCADLGAFDAVNQSYNAFFESSPVCPSRSCVEVPLGAFRVGSSGEGKGKGDGASSKVPVLALQGVLIAGSSSPKVMRELKGGAADDSSATTDGSVSTASFERSLLHVRSLSTWAPLCIGPYAQANSSFSSSGGPSLHLIAGQIGLVPETMKMAEPSSSSPSASEPLEHHHHRFAAELCQSLQNAVRVLECAAGVATPLLPPQGFAWPPSSQIAAAFGVKVKVREEGEGEDSDSDGGYESEDQRVKAAVRRKETFARSPLVPAVVFVSMALLTAGHEQEDLAQRERLVAEALSFMRSIYGIRIHLAALVCVPALPRNALVEVEVQGWHNGKASGEGLETATTAAATPLPGSDPLSAEFGEWKKFSAPSFSSAALEMRLRSLCWHPKDGAKTGDTDGSGDEDDDADARLLRESAARAKRGDTSSLVASSAAVSWGLLAIELRVDVASLSSLDLLVASALRSHSSLLESIARKARTCDKTATCSLTVYFPAAAPAGSLLPSLVASEEGLSSAVAGDAAGSSRVSSLAVPTASAAHAAADAAAKISVLVAFDCC